MRSRLVDGLMTRRCTPLPYREPFTEENALLTLLPSVEIRAIQTAAIRATMIAYSTIVAAASSRARSRKTLIRRLSVDSHSRIRLAAWLVKGSVPRQGRNISGVGLAR